MIDITNLVLNLVLWAGFALIHTLFASKSIKNIIPLNGRSYRIFYNIIAGISFLIVLYLLPPIISLYSNLSDLTFWRTLVFLLIQGIGVIILFWGLTAWDLSGFVGLSTENDDLKLNGPYRFSRHPVYSGIILILCSFLMVELSTISLSWVFGAGSYLILGTVPEERKLYDHYGSSYHEFQQNIPRLFPYKMQHFKNLLN